MPLWDGDHGGPRGKPLIISDNHALSGAVSGWVLARPFFVVGGGYGIGTYDLLSLCGPREISPRAVGRDRRFTSAIHTYIQYRYVSYVL